MDTEVHRNMIFNSLKEKPTKGLSADERKVLKCAIKWTRLDVLIHERIMYCLGLFIQRVQRG